MSSVNPYNMSYYDKYTSKKSIHELRQDEEKELLKSRKLTIGANAQLPTIASSSSIICKTLNKDTGSRTNAMEDKREEIRQDIKDKKIELQNYKEEIRDGYADRKASLLENKQKIFIGGATGLIRALSRSFY